MSFDVKKKIEELNKSDIISGSNARYDIVHEEELKDLNSAGIILRHKKSGARVVVISNDDNNKVFSIGFKTPPFNDTGMQHIIEHSTLCGSRKYPVKDPFVELCKGSLNTFLNAMTYPDKTVYPVASCNDTDFKNIMDVYMDAVFYPAMYEKPEIFMQEGWHYELDNADDDIKYNGVVFNEMKGAFHHQMTCFQDIHLYHYSQILYTRMNRAVTLRLYLHLSMKISLSTTRNIITHLTAIYISMAIWTLMKDLNILTGISIRL